MEVNKGSRPNTEEMAETCDKATNMVIYIAEKECEENGVPINAVPSILLNGFKETLFKSVEHIVNTEGPKAGLESIKLYMTVVQEIVKQVDKANTELEEFAKKEN